MKKLLIKLFNKIIFYYYKGQFYESDPLPYVIEVKNPTDKDLNFVLFGKRTHLLTANYGSDINVEISMGVKNVTYLQLLQQSAEQPFETSLLRIRSSNSSQVTQDIDISYEDNKGMKYNAPIIARSYFSANQFQSGIIDIPRVIKINGDTSLRSKILKNTQATYIFFPFKKEPLSKLEKLCANAFIGLFLYFILSIIGITYLLIKLF